MDDFPVPVLGFIARSGTGKTTLLSRLIPELRARSIRSAVVKHSHHDFEIDKQGKDSHRLRKSGAQQVVLASPFRTFWVEEGDGVSEPQLAALLRRLDVAQLDLVLVEGFRQEHFPKIEVHRPSLGKSAFCLEDGDVIAVAADAEPAVPVAVPMLPLNDVAKVADFVCRWLSGQAPRSRSCS